VIPIFFSFLPALDVKTQITGQLFNTGRGLQFKLSPFSAVSSSSHSASLEASKANSTVIISGGPLSYEYSLHHLLFHYGRTDDRGSEHTISEVSFPAEVQFYFFNSQLYNSWEDAVEQPNGLAAISVLIQMTKERAGGTHTSSKHSSSSHHQKQKQENQIQGNSQLKHLFHSLDSIKYKGSATKVHKLSFSQLLPSLRHYITYEGSLTQPSCVETVQWIISNKPLYMNLLDLQMIRNTVVLEGQGEGNFRPVQPVNSRSLRTNIPISGTDISDVSETTTMKYSASSNPSPFAKVTPSSTLSSEVNQSINKKKLCSGRGFIAYKG